MAMRVATSLLSHHPSAGYPNPLGLAGAVASQMAAMVVTLSPHGEPSWLSVEPLCLDVASFCTGVHHGSADGGHECGLLSDAR
jgi:hypothetical protein